jgi:hypothetical protein
MATTSHSITIDGETTSIATARELMVALDVLQGQHDREVLEQLSPHLADIVADGAGLYAVLKVLSPADSEPAEGS